MTLTPLVGAALIAFGGVLLTAAVQLIIARRSREQLTIQAERSLVETRRSADAAERSSRAAEEAVGLNGTTAAALARRAELDSRLKRYQDAATQIGHDRAPVRVAGVYALSSLADEWSEQRQTCVDVLCAYLQLPNLLRTPVDGSQGFQDDPSDYFVRSSIRQVIREHLRSTAEVPWWDMRFNFNSASLYSFRLLDSIFDQAPVFYKARFTGGTSLFENMELRSGADMRYMTIEGKLHLSLAGLDGALDLTGTHITNGGELVLECNIEHGDPRLVLDDLLIEGAVTVKVGDCGTVQMNGVRVDDAEVAVQIGRRSGFSQSRLYARNWAVSGSAPLVVRAVSGEGALPAARSVHTTWDLNWSGHEVPRS